MRYKKIAFIIAAAVLSALPLFASSGGIGDEMANLVIQLGFIIIVAKVSGIVFTKIRMPSVLGELLAGVVIGPHMLGSTPLPGFSHGLFPLDLTASIPVSAELYAIGSIASILLLFIAGMETDIAMFLKFSVKGSIIGISGVASSFIFGAASAALWLNKSFGDPICLFMGVLSTATSVGITARIFSDNKKMDTPEGVTILSAAVIDDVIGIILLAIVVGIAGSTGAGKSIDYKVIVNIGVKAVVIWLGATFIGMVLASRISKFLKIFKSVSAFSMIALAMAFLLSGFFEKEGLAMIIGAYVMGLTISKTDVTYAIQDELKALYNFFVPVFFTVMGMMVDIHQLTSPSVLIFGGVFSLLAVLSKIIGCGIPASFLNFNFLGSMRIGIGMVPRGEVALIIAGIGLSTKILPPDVFGICILMTLVTTIIPPPILGMIIKNPKKGTRKDIEGFDTTSTEYSFPSSEIRELIVDKIIHAIEQEGFFVNKVEMEGDVFHMRKDEVFFSMNYDDQKIYFNSDKADVSFIKTVVYESILSIHETIEQLKNLAKPEDMRKELVSDDSRIEFNVFKVLSKENIKVNLKGISKEEIINELIEILDNNKLLKNKNDVLQAVMQREQSMSTGMQFGVALPHGKTDTGVDYMCAALGIKKEGIDFESIDGEPSKIFVLLVSNKSHSSPHIQFLSAVSAILNIEDARNRLIESSDSDEAMRILTEYQKGNSK